MLWRVRCDCQANRLTKRISALHQAAAQNALANSRSVMAILPTRRSVFVVDDDPSMRASLKRLLREYGFDAAVFE